MKQGEEVYDKSDVDEVQNSDVVDEEASDDQSETSSDQGVVRENEEPTESTTSKLDTISDTVQNQIQTDSSKKIHSENHSSEDSKENVTNGLRRTEVTKPLPFRKIFFKYQNECLLKEGRVLDFEYPETR